MGIVSKIKLSNAMYDYYEYMIAKMQEIERRKLPKRYRKQQEEQDNEDKKMYLKSISMRKLSETAQYSKQYFKREYNRGSINEDEYYDIEDRLKSLEKRVKDNIKVQAPKGTAKECENRAKDTKHKKVNIKGIIAVVVCASMIAGGAIYIHSRNKENEKKQEEHLKKLQDEERLDEAKKVLEDKQYSVYELAAEAKSQQNSSYLIDEVSKVFSDEFNNRTGANISEVTIVEEKIVIGRNSTTGEIVHADRNLLYYINQGFETSIENRYLVFAGDAIGEDGKFIENNFLGECTEDGELFTDSKSLRKEASEILSEMAQTSQIEYTKYDGTIAKSDSMLKSSFDFKEGSTYGDSDADLGDKIASYNASANQYYENNGINLKREYGNKLVTDVNGNVITYIYEFESDEHKQKVKQALETIKNIEKEQAIDVALENDDSGWEL